MERQGPILKERLFGLTNSEGNHGEDVKEYYFYLDSTPTHSYMKYLYKYPQAAYPYGDLIETNRRRGKHDFEYELLDTGVFDQDRYFDVFVEYAKASPEDLLIRITVENRGPEPATLHVLPTVWFRRVWSWGGDAPRPVLRQAAGDAGGVIAAAHPDLGERFFYCGGAAALLFTENETNHERLFNSPNRTSYVKDGIDRYIVHGRREAVNPEQQGTKAAAHYLLTVGAGESRTLRLRLCDVAPAASAPTKPSPFGSDFDAVMQARRQEADEFYASVIPSSLNADAANVMRQALVTFVPLGASARFPALQSRAIDLLARNTTWTLAREAGLNVQFPGILFYDGQAFVVPAASRVKSVAQLKGATVCVEKGTTHEGNLADYFGSTGRRSRC